MRELSSLIGGYVPSDAVITTSSGTGLEVLFVNDPLSGEVIAYEIIAPGLNYATTETINVDAVGGTGAVITIDGVDGDGAVTSINISNGGSGYFFKGVLVNTSIRMCTLVEFDWQDRETLEVDTIRLTDAFCNLTWNGNEFMALGALGSIDTVEEGFDLQAYSIQLKLSGIPNELRKEVFADVNYRTSYQNRPCRVCISFLDEAYGVYNNPILIFEGQMDACSLEVSQTVAIAITVQSRLVNWEVPIGGRYNSNDQKAWYPEDTGFDFIPELIDKEIKWGEKPESEYGSGSTGGTGGNTSGGGNSAGDTGYRTNEE